MKRNLAMENNVIEYMLTRKSVKNINVRVTDSGIFVSAPPNVRIIDIERFLSNNEKFLKRATDRISKYTQIPAPEDPQYAEQMCIDMTAGIMARLYPIFRERAAACGYTPPSSPPSLRYRDLTSRWGSCKFNENLITINTRLVQIPYKYSEYVVVHELCHLAVPNHSPSFHALCREILPDADLRRREMKLYHLEKRK